MGKRALNKKVRRDLSNLAGLRVALYCRASDDDSKVEKSVEDQEGVGRAWAEHNGCVVVDVYKDNDRSASRFATKDREDFERLVRDLRDGRIDVLWVWEVSRSQRMLRVYADLRDLCRDRDVPWVVRDRVYDLNNYMDLATLGIFAVHGELEAEMTSERVRRGMASSAAKGRPHGKTIYGYRRVYDQQTKQLLRQEPDEELRRAVAADGSVTTYSHAGVVREIFRRVSEGDPLITVERDLNARGIPSPAGSTWVRSAIRRKAMTAAYVGKRVHHGEVIGNAIWPPLVDEEQYWACVRLLEDPTRTTTKPARAVYLLSYLARCGECGEPLQCTKANRHGWKGQIYACLRNRCAAVKMEYLDEYIERIVVAWMGRQDVHERLHTSFDDRAVGEARAEAERLNRELAAYRAQAAAGKMKAVDWVVISEGLEKQITDAEARATEAGLPPVLRGRVGPHAAKEWAALADNIAVRRDIIRVLLSIELLKVGRGSRVKLGPQRLRLRWLIGPDDGVETDAVDVAAAA